MRKMALTLFGSLLVALCGWAQSSTEVCLIYVDASASSSLPQLRSKIQSVVEAHYGQRVLLYVSNGDFPVVAANANSLDSTLDRLEFIRPGHPDYFQDMDSINSLLSDTYPTQTLNGPRDQVNLPVSFCFFLNVSQAALYHEEEVLVDRLLQSNRLILGQQRQWLLHEASIYLDTARSTSGADYLTRLQQQKKYDVYAY